MSVLVNIAVAAMTVTSLMLAVVAWTSWRRAGGARVALVAMGFTLFACKAIVLSVALFASRAWGAHYLPVSVVADLAILGVFYVAMFKRPS